MIFLRTSEGSGSCFIRTDQLDGETDWKLRLAIQATQHLESDRDLFDISAQVYAEKPQKDIHNFIGTFSRVSSELFFFFFGGGSFSKNTRILVSQQCYPQKPAVAVVVRAPQTTEARMKADVKSFHSEVKVSKLIKWFPRYNYLKLRLCLKY